MKRKKLITAILIVMFLIYGIVFAKKGYEGYQYKKVLEQYDKYNKNDLIKYLDYHFENEEVSIEDVLKIVNNDLIQFNYSEAFISFLNDPDCKTENMDKYLKCPYQDDIHETVLIVNNYFDKLRGYNINYLLNFAKEKYYINKNLRRYIEYYETNPNYSLRQVIESVNCNRDREYYTDTEQADLSADILILCNKYYYLPKEYVPNDLVKMDDKYSTGGVSLKKEAYDAFIEMHNAAEKDDYYISVNGNNAYRSYTDQQSTYSFYEKIYGTDGADTCSARPGFSEHQTGLTADLGTTTLDGTEFTTYTEEYQWLIDNSWKYGFIFRYQENKESYTGYQCEQWHYRYVGKQVAEYINQNDITFDEYYQYFVADNNITETEFLNLFNQ